jgi:methyltransferase (TIGR00027 family)
VGAREPDSTVRNPDSLAEKLLGDPSTLTLQHPIVRALSLPYDEAMNDVEVVNIVRLMVIRTRYIDDALARAVNGGARQVVILGAGFDSHAYRCQELLAGVRVFEVDRPATQALKRQRVDAVLGGPPRNLTYVPSTFSTRICATYSCATATIRASERSSSSKASRCTCPRRRCERRFDSSVHIRQAAASCSITSTAR